MENYKIEKWLWTHEDFEQMGWHDATIRAIAFLSEDYELVLDVDYIFEWVEPSKSDTYYKFWISPVTLVFENVNDVVIDLELFDEVQLQDIKRGESREPRNKDYISREIEWEWTVDSNVGEINLWAIGYKQFVRSAPILSRKQKLSLDERGGFSFLRGRGSKPNK